MKLQHAIVAIVAWVTLDAFGAVYNSAPKVDSIADLTNRVVSTSTTMTTPYVEVARLSPSHPYWNRPRTARLSLTATNAITAGVIYPTSTGTGRWIFDDVFSGNPIDAQWFGVFAGTNSAAEITRNTEGLKNALAFTDSIFNGRPELILPAGMIFTDGGITNEATPMKGASWLDFTGGSMWHSTVLRLNRGSTNDLLILAGDEGVKPSIRDMQLMIESDSGRRYPKTITSVATRKRFFVAVSDIPETPSSPTTWPYYGPCFFYGSEGNYLGSGIVSNVNGVTGEITLEDGSDRFATASGNGGLLTAGMQVCWSPIVTESFSTQPDPTRAGPAAIRMLGPGYVTIENVHVWGGHVGLAMGVSALGGWINNFSVFNMRFAGIANRGVAINSDLWVGRFRQSSTWAKDWDAPNDALTIIDTAFRETAYGIYLPSYTSSFDDVLIANAVVGVMGDRMYHVSGGNWVLDDITSHGILWHSGNTVSAENFRPSALTIGNLLVRPNFYAAAQPTNKPADTAAITIKGNSALNADIRIGVFSVEAVQGYTNRFDYAYDAPDNGEIEVSAGVLGAFNGARERNRQQLLYQNNVRTFGSSISNKLETADAVRVTIAQTNSATTTARFTDVREVQTGGIANAFEEFRLNGAQRYIHYLTGDIYHVAPTASTHAITFKTDATNYSEIVARWGQNSLDARLELYGNQILSEKTSDGTPVPLLIQDPGGDVWIGGSTTNQDRILWTPSSTNIVLRISADTTNRFLLYNDGLVDWRVNPIGWYAQNPYWGVTAQDGASGLTIAVGGVSSRVLGVKHGATELLRVGTNNLSTTGSSLWIHDGTSQQQVKISSGAEKALYLGSEPTFGGGGGTTNGLGINAVYRTDWNLVDTTGLQYDVTSVTNAGVRLKDRDWGDVTTSASGATITVDNDAVTYAKIQNVSAASRLLGRGSAAGAGDVEELTIGSGLLLSGTVLSATGGGSGAGTNVFLNNVLMQPAKFTNNTSSDAGRVMWYTNAAGDILAYATNLPAGGSGSNTVVLVNGTTSVTNPNFVHSTNVQAVVTAATNISFVVTNSGVTPGAYTAANITVGADGRVISAANGTVGEANTASNLGTPSATVQGLYNSKSGVDLRFRSLEAGTGITLTSNANTLVVNSSGSSSTFSTNNLGYLERSVTLVTNTESGGEVPHYTITIPGNTLGVNGDEVEIHIPGTFSAYTTGTNSAYTFRWSFDSALGGADNVHVVNMSSTYFTQTSTEYSLDWKLRIKRIDSNTVVTSSEHFAGPHVDSGSTNNLVSSLGTMWIDFNGDLGTDPADFTIYTDIIDDTRAARLKTFGYLVAKVGSGSGSGGGIPISVNATNYPTAFNLADQSGATKVKTSGGTNASIALSKMQVGHFTALDNQPPTNNYATFATRNAFAVLEFDPSTEESARGVFVVPEGADLSSGLTFKITWTTAATSGNGRWGVQVMRLNTDIDSDSFDTAGEATTAANGTSGIPSTTTITLTTIDSVAAGEPFAVRIYRDTGDAADTIDSNDLQLMVVDISTAY